MTNEERVKMFRMRLEGATLQEIADKYGVTREWVRQLIPGIEGRGRKPKPAAYPALSEWLQDNELSRFAFGKMCGVSTCCIGNILNGKRDPSKDTIDAILKVTGLPYEEAFRKGESED